MSPGKMSDKTVPVGSDHAAPDVKCAIISQLKSLGYEPLDMGTSDTASCDYPDYAKKVAELVSSGECARGILLCGTGIGMSIAANKFPKIRAALVHDLFTAEMSRRHNDANILVIGARVTGPGLIEAIVKLWLETPFEGSRHQRRLDKIAEFESATRSSTERK